MSSPQTARRLSPRVVTIHQPDFLPWLGFFQRWAASDLYVVLDDVQFLRRGWHNRDRIKTAQGPAWLSVPTRKKGRFDQLINEVELDNGVNWRRKHLATLQAAYAKAPGRAGVLAELAEIYARGHERLLELNLDLLRWAAQALDITTPWVLASEFGVQETSTPRLARLMAEVGGEVYLTGTGSRDYLDEEQFSRRGMLVQWQEFRQPVYPQLHGEFLAGLSVLDYLLMRTGHEQPLL